MSKKIVITGASRGIGFHTARLLVHQGHTVLAIARSAEKLETLAGDCENMKGSLLSLAGDVCEADQLAGAIRNKLSEVDILINNAAAFLKKPLSDLSLNELQHIYNVNVFAPLMLVKHLQTAFATNGHIVNISSVGGVGGSLKFKELLPYSSSKGALNIITECLAVELREHHIYCNALALGSSSTEMFKAAFPGMEAATSPAQMARFIADFALNAAPLMNGKVISVSAQNP